MIEALAAEAAHHWNGRILRLIRNRENAVFEIALPQARAALRLHRQGYQDDAAIRSELWWCAALAAKGVAVPAALPARDGALWLGTSAGLVKVSWKSARVGNGRDRVARTDVGIVLPSEQVNGLMEDKEGRIWVATRAGLGVVEVMLWPPDEISRL